MLRLAIVGCGVMGRRHVLGLGRLRDVDRASFELVAACDTAPENAAALADLAKRTLGTRPQVFASLEAMADVAVIDALDLTTAPALHLALAREAFAAGWHVIVEKPIALTVRDGREMIAAARQAERVLAVAENYRRDPINRLARALLDAGAIGRPYLAMQTFSAWGGRVIITPWRHRQAAGGIAIDMGVHYADVLEYLLGPIQTVVGMGALVDHVRVASDDSQVTADAEDLTVGVGRFANGALASWTLDLAGRGEELFTRRIHGTGGTLFIPNDRTGQPLALTVTRSGAPCAVDPEDQLALVPGFTLHATTAALFGQERLASYDFPWTDIDANLVAIELDDFARAISTGDSPEVSGEMGLRSLAIAYGILESERAGRILAVEEILDGRTTSYQDALEAALGENAPQRAIAG
jgi:predicted dehydrogenase